MNPRGLAARGHSEVTAIYVKPRLTSSELAFHSGGSRGVTAEDRALPGDEDLITPKANLRFILYQSGSTASLVSCGAAQKGLPSNR